MITANIYLLERQTPPYGGSKSLKDVKQFAKEFKNSWVIYKRLN